MLTTVRVVLTVFALLISGCANTADAPKNNLRTVDGNTFSDCPANNGPSVPYGWNAYRTKPAGLISYGVAAVRLAPDANELLFVSNGQDNAAQPLVAVQAEPDAWPVWYSENYDFQGRLKTGDINGDGYPEIALPIFANKFRYYQQGGLHIYANKAGKLSPSYAQRIDVGGAVLEVAFGDADADGDLDLATAILGTEGQLQDAPTSGTGDTIIFENMGGKIASKQFWTAEEVPKCPDPRVNGPCNFVLSMMFADVNQDGIMDLVANGNRLRIYYGQLRHAGTAQEKTSISVKPGWQSKENWGLGYSLSLGWQDWRNRRPMLAVSSYAPAGSGTPFRIYTPSRSNEPSWQSQVVGQGGGLLIHDVNGDQYTDLITSSQGDNKQPVRIFLGNKNGYSTAPQFCSGSPSDSSPRSINCDVSLYWGGTIVAAEGSSPSKQACEVFTLGTADTTPSSDSACVETLLPASHAGYVFTLKRSAAKISAIKIGGEALSRKFYAATPGGMTVSLGRKVKASTSVEITYQYLPEPDLVVADMDPLCGLGIFQYQP